MCNRANLEIARVYMGARVLECRDEAPRLSDSGSQRRIPNS